MAALLLAMLPIPLKFSKWSKADQCHRKINAGILQDVFASIFAHLEAVAYDRITIDCADSKIRLCVEILCAWIADNMEKMALPRLKTNNYPKCVLPTHEVGTNARSH